MKKSLVATLIVATLVITPLQGQADEHRGESGAGFGVLVGAIAGGPLGAVIGGALGAGVGHDLDREAELEALRGRLDRERAETVRLRGELAAARESRGADTNLLLALGAGVEQKIHFRGNGDRLETFELERLTALAALLEAAPRLKVRLAGHADPRGSEDTNLALSQRRVASVKGALTRAGIDPARITSDAFGEQRTLSTTGDHEAYPFDRRVTLKLVVE